MTVHQRAERRDDNEPAVVDALRKAGALVERLSGPGLPDLLVLYRGQLFLIDVKSRRGQATMAQKRLLAQGWPIWFVRTPDAALVVIGAVKAVPCG